MPTVWITNRGGHDYSAAEKYGTLHFLTEGKVKRYATSTAYREFIDQMCDATIDDWLLISSLSILNSIASAILARRFGRVNFLLFCDGKYLPRSIDIDSLLTKENADEEDHGSDGEEGRIRRDASSPEDDTSE